jgi:acyl carrier protein
MQMTREECIKEIETILEADAGTLDGALRLEEIGNWDSLAVLSFITFADEKLGITLRPTEIKTANTINELISLLGEQVTD